MKSQAETPQKELTIAERVVVLRKIREQPPNISHRQLAEITGVPRTTLAQILQDFGQSGQPLNRAKWCLSRCDPIKRNLLYLFLFVLAVTFKLYVQICRLAFFSVHSISGQGAFLIKAMESPQYNPMFFI